MLSNLQLAEWFSFLFAGGFARGQAVRTEAAEGDVQPSTTTAGNLITAASLSLNDLMLFKLKFYFKQKCKSI
ncbi:hypothetical protein [Paraclostridium dentum]|uniref:hypothetical protein n=1 Tax=Paraclostridium dentum TaxID=2662455 RepID=UPI003F40715E